MKRALIIPLIVLVLATMACSLGTSKPTATSAEPTKTVVQAVQATEPPSQPTDTETAPTIILPTETEVPTDTPAGPDTFTDNFDQTNKFWSDPVIVTSQAAGREPYVKITAGGGRMRFAIEDTETYVYRLFLKDMVGTSTIEVDFQNKGAINTGIAIVCKANKELNKWYEVRVSASDNNFFFYQYDKKRKEELGKNPYVQLGKGHMKIDEYYPTKPNHIVVSCTDSEITLDVNKGKKQGSQALEEQLDGNIMGVGVMSANLLPATIDFDTVVIR